MRDPARLRLVCAMVWFDKQAIISWNPEKKPRIIFDFHTQSVVCGIDQPISTDIGQALKNSA